MTYNAGSSPVRTAEKPRKRYVCGAFFMIAFFKQTYPFSYGYGRNAKLALAIAAFTFIFLYGLDPIGISNGVKFGVLWVTLGYGLIAGLSFLVYFGLFVELTKNSKLVDNWTVGRELLLYSGLFLMVGIINSTLRPVFYEGEHGLNLSILVSDVSNTFKIGFVILGVLTWLNIGYLIRTNEAKAEIVQLFLRKTERQNRARPKKKALPKTIHVESQYDEVEIDPTQTVFIMASGNYVEIYSEKQGKLERSLKRIALKAVEDALPENSSLLRVHRAYLVNVDMVEDVSGNAQGYQLRVKGTEMQVPVSRSFLTEFNDRVAERHAS